MSSVARILQNLDPKPALLSGLILLLKLPTANAETTGSDRSMLPYAVPLVITTMGFLYCWCCRGENRQQPAQPVLREPLPAPVLERVVIMPNPPIGDIIPDNLRAPLTPTMRM